MDRMQKSLRKLIVRYTVTCLSVFVIAICFLVPIYMIAFDNTQQLFMQDTTAQLTMALDSLMSDIEYMQSSLFVNMREDDIFLRIATGRDNMPDAAQLAKYTEEYQKTYLPDTVYETLIFFKRTDLLVTHARMLMPSQYQLDVFFQYGSYGIDEWREILFTEQKRYYPQETISFKERKNMTGFVYNYYYPTTTAPSAVISVVLDAQKVMDLFLVDALEESGFVYIADTDGAILASYSYEGDVLADPANGETIHRNGEQYTLITLSSQGQGMTVVAGIDRQVFHENVQPLLVEGLSYLGIALLIALAGSIAYAFYNVRSLKPVLSRIAQLAPAGTAASEGAETAYEEPDLYHYMDVTLNAAAKRYSDIQKEISVLKKDQTEELFDLMLQGEYRGASLQTSYLRDVPLLRGSYILALAHFEHKERRAVDYERTMVASVIEDTLPDVYVHHGGHLCAVIGVAHSGGMEAAMAGLERVRQILLGMSPDITLRFGVSAPAGGMGMLSMAYDQAGYAVQYLLECPEETVAQYTQIPEKPRRIDFSQFEHLYHQLLVGDSTGVEVFFEETLPAQINRVVNSSEQESVFRILTNVLLSVMDKLPDPSSVYMGSYQSDVPPMKLISMYGETAQAICSGINSGKRSHNVKLKDEIIAYIERSYANPNLNLTMIGDHFRISQRYASQFIKEQTGQNYTALLESIRLGQAQKLLSETDLPIAQVASAVGFENKNTFYKAFKRRLNVSPLIYRSMMVHGSGAGQDGDDQDTPDPL